jgi:syntaxin-binding protein 1
MGFQQELIEKLSKGELPLNEYPSLSEPSPTAQGTAQSGSAAKPAQNPQPMSRRSRRTPQYAKSRNSDDGQSRYSLKIVFHLNPSSPYKFSKNKLL